MYVGDRISALDMMRSRDIARRQSFPYDSGLEGFWGSATKVFKNAAGYFLAVPSGGTSLALTTSPTARRIGATTSLFSIFMPASMRARVFGLSPSQSHAAELVSKGERGVLAAVAAVYGGWAAFGGASATGGAAGAGGATAGSAGTAGGFSLVPAVGAGQGAFAATAAAPTFSLASTTLAPGAGVLLPSAAADMSFTGLAKAGILFAGKTVLQTAAVEGTQALVSSLVPKPQDTGGPQQQPTSGFAPVSSGAQLPTGGAGASPIQTSDSQPPSEGEPSIFGIPTSTLFPVGIAGALALGLYLLNKRGRYAHA